MIATGIVRYSGPQKPEEVNHLFEALRRYPRGTTAKVIAKKFGWTPVYASHRLGRLAMYGVIDRVPDPSRSISGRAYRYQVKPRASHA